MVNKCLLSYSSIKSRVIEFDFFFFGVGVMGCHQRRIL